MNRPIASSDSANLDGTPQSTFGVGLMSIRNEILAVMRGAKIVDEEFLTIEQYISSGLVTVDFVKTMLQRYVKLSTINAIVAELFDYLQDKTRRDLVLDHIQGATTFTTVAVEDLPTWARHYKCFVDALGRSALCEWLEVCDIKYAFQAITGELTFALSSLNDNLVFCAKHHTSSIKVILDAYRADTSQGSDAILQFFYLHCYKLVQQQLIIGPVMERLSQVDDPVGYIELCHALTPFLVRDTCILASKLDTIVEFVNSGKRDRSLSMSFWVYISDHLLIEYPGLWPDFIFYPFTVSQKNPLIEGKVKSFILDDLIGYVDDANWPLWRSYINSKLLYQLDLIDKFRTVTHAIRDKPEVKTHFKKTLDYFLAHKQKKLGSYISLITQCVVATPVIDPAGYILKLQPLNSRSLQELQSLIDERKSGSDSFESQVLSAVAASQGLTIINQLYAIVNKCQKHNLPLTIEGQRTLNALAMVYTDKALMLCEQMIQRQLLSNMKDQFPNVGISDDALMSEQMLLLYQMSIASKKNKQQAQELLNHVVTDTIYRMGRDIHVSYPYDLPQNKSFLAGLDKRSRSVWLDTNAVVYNVSSESVSMSKESRIKHHFELAKHILHQAKINIPCDTLEDLIHAYKYLNANRREQSIAGIYVPNLALQIQSIKKLQQPAVKIDAYASITIYKELDPTNICMMGDRVDGSCLSFHSGVGNNRSVFTNALECNKGVYYIKDEHDKIIGRFIVAITKDKKLALFPVYYKGYAGVDLLYYVKQYAEKLSRDMNMPLGGKSGDVALLFCDDRYTDPEYTIE